MKTTSQDSVRSLFNLPKEEKVYDDFGCAFQDVILFHGRLFLTENYICFNSNILGLKNKCVLSLKDVKEIKKRKTLGLFNNSIVISSWDDKKKQNIDYIFTSFTSRNIAYKRIRMVWKSTLRLHNIDLESATKSDSDSNSSKEDTHSTLGYNRASNFSDMNSLDQDLDNSNVSKEDVYFPPIDPEKVYEGCKITIKENISQIYEKFIKDNAEYGLGHFYEQVIGHTSVSLTEWKQIEENVYVRDVNFLMKVKEVPFVSQTRVHKTQKLKKEGDKFTMWGSSTSLDVPYASYFSIEDTWEFIPNQGQSVLRTTIYAAFTKSTMFKSKIEKKTKEEFKKEVDKWCEFASSKGFSYENYKAISLRKSSKSEEDSLKHGIEKNQLKQENLLVIKSKVNSVKDFFFELYSKNSKEILIFFVSVIVIVLLIVLIAKLNSLIYLVTKNSEELSEIITILNIERSNGNILSEFNNNSSLLNTQIEL